MQALESAKQFVDICHIEPCAIITDKVRASIGGIILDSEFNVGKFLLGREFPGIIEQVLQYYLHQARINIGSYIWRDGKLNNPLWVGLLKGTDNILGNRAEICRLRVERCTRHAREIEQVVDQLCHALGSSADAHQVVTTFIVQLISKIFQDCQAESVNRAERRTQIMRDRITKG